MAWSPIMGAMSLFARIHEAKFKTADTQVIAQVEKAAKKAAKKPLAVVSSKQSHKGWDFTFKDGGRFKIRARPDGAFTVKLQGTPKPHYRFRGDGPSLGQALASLKPEKKDTPTPVATPPFKKGKKPPENPWEAGTMPGPKAANINGLRFHNDLGVDQETFDRYAMAAKDSVDLLKRRGFGFMVPNVTMHLREGKPGIAGNYDMHGQYVEIFVNIIGAKTEPKKIMFTMVHELGHHYYYREISRAKRKSYRWYFDKAYGGTAPLDPAQGNKRVKPGAAAKAHAAGAFPTNYGATVRYEDFAEIFAAYIGKGHALSTKYKLTPDIMQRFKSFMADDKRVDLREDDTGRPAGSSLYERVIGSALTEGFTPMAPGCHDRMRHHSKVPQLDKAERESNRMSDLARSRRSAIMCREKGEVERYMGLVVGAIANIKREINDPKAKSAFGHEAWVIKGKPAGRPAKAQTAAAR